MLQKLASAPRPLVEYERHRGVRLSPEGKRRALEVVRHHRLLETFLYQVLGYPIEEVHEEAERLEHFISERFEERIAAKLGNPKIDPHGHCIPALDGQMPAPDSVPLSEMVNPGVWKVASIADEDATQLKWFSRNGIAPGVLLKVESCPAESTCAVRIGTSARVVHLSNSAARAIRIQPLPMREALDTANTNASRAAIQPSTSIEHGNRTRKNNVERSRLD